MENSGNENVIDLYTLLNVSKNASKEEIVIYIIIKKEKSL